ncbi:Bifunctional epoxide hydrolase 2 [Linum grandiflorum]
MDPIEHKFVEVEGGLKLHVAEIGSGDKAILFLHGFPEIWYSWRHQMIALSQNGYRCIAVDYRGYGLSDPPAKPEEDAKYVNIVADLVAILDFLTIPKVRSISLASVNFFVRLWSLRHFVEQVVLVGKDFGSFVATWFEVLHPEKVLGLVNLGVPFMVPIKGASMANQLPEGFYVSRWRVPGRAEADFGRFDAKTVVRNVYILFSGSELQIAAENQEIMDLVDPSTPLPPWFTEEDLDAYGALYRKSGFRTALQMPYRSFDEYIDIQASEVKVNVPALLIMGSKDYALKLPGMEGYINNIARQFVPDLKTVFIAEGNHFVQEQLPEEVNQLILDFLGARIWP